MQTYSAYDYLSRRVTSMSQVSIRSQSLEKAKDLHPSRDQGPRTSVVESVIIHSGLSSALTSPRLYDQYTLHTALSDYVDPTGLSPAVKNAFLTVSRKRENRLISLIFEALKLETVVTNYAIRYYETQLKQRLYKVLAFNSRLPKLCSVLSKLLLATHWKKYKKRISLAKIRQFCREKLLMKSIKSLKKRIFRNSRVNFHYQKYTRKCFSNWKNSFKSRKLLLKITRRIAKKVLLNWHYQSHKTAILSTYFQALSKYTHTKIAFRRSKLIRLTAFQAQLGNMKKIRIWKEFMRNLKEKVKEKFEMYVKSSVKLHNYKLKIAKMVLREWLKYVNRPISRNITKKKVFTALQNVIYKKKRENKAFYAVKYRSKRRFFVEWRKLMTSEVYQQVKNTENYYNFRLKSRIFNHFLDKLNAKKYAIALASQHHCILTCKYVFTGWKRLQFTAKSIRFADFLQFKRLKKCWMGIRGNWEERSMFHQSIYRTVRRKIGKNAVFMWRKATIISQMEDEKRAGDFYIGKKLENAFDELKEGFYMKKIVFFNHKKTKRLFKAWWAILNSLHFYRFQAKSGIFSTSFSEESNAEDSFLIGNATKSVNSQLKNSKKMRKIKEFVEKRRKLVKSKSFGEMKKGIKWKIVKRKGKIRGNLVVLKHIWKFWREIWEKRREKLEMFIFARNKIQGIKAKTVLNRLKLHFANKNTEKQYDEIAFRHFFTKKSLEAFRFFHTLLQNRHLISSKLSKISKFRQTTLKNRVFKSFKLHHFSLNSRLSATKLFSTLLLRRHFSLLQKNRRLNRNFTAIKEKSSHEKVTKLFSTWVGLYHMHKSLHMHDYKQAIASAAGISAWETINNSLFNYSIKRKTIRGLWKFAVQNRNLREKSRKIEEFKVKKIAKLTVKRWKIFKIQRMFTRKITLKRLKKGINALNMHRFFEKLHKKRSSRLLKTLFFTWKIRNFQKSTDFLPNYFTLYPQICKKPILLQLFRAWRRKITWKKQLSAWKLAKNSKFLHKFWFLLKFTHKKMISEREKTFILHKKLLLEMKKLFRKIRICDIFRRQKLGLKSFQALKLGLLASDISKNPNNDSVFLYLPKSDADKIEEMLRNESSLVDEQQLALENELSMLTYELANTPDKRKKPPPDLLVFSSVNSGVSPEKPGRKLLESSQDVLKSYIHYRHSMRALDHSSIRRFSSSKPPNSSKKSSISHSRPRDYELSDLLQIEDLGA